MPRQARLMLAGVPVLVVQRGRTDSPCFLGAADYVRYLGELADLAPRFACAVHAYCLMPDHVHLLLTPATPAGCGALMKHLGQRHAQYINRTRARSGGLWEGRFRSCLIEEERYFLACQRYVELNPVRAGAARLPGDYPWSSYRHHAEAVSGIDAPIALAPHASYLGLGFDDQARRAMYRALSMLMLDSRVIEAIRQATNSGSILGGARFAASIEDRLGRRVLRGLPGRPSRSALGVDAGRYA